MDRLIAELAERWGTVQITWRQPHEQGPSIAADLERMLG